MASSGSTRKITVNQLLGSGGTATLASATITGDLTVDTNVLKVDTSNNRVGIGTASPTVPLYVTGNNATATAIMQDETNGAKLRLLANSINFDLSNGGGGGDIAVSGANPLTFRTNGTERARIDSSGNVGVGVTPSAWNSAVPALQVKGVSGVYGAGSSEFGSVQNCFFNASSQWIYGTTAASGRYAISSGVHQWFNAPSGTAGNAITFTQAMTLDASGNLLVGLTSGSYNRIKKDSTADAGNAIFELVGASNATSSIHYSVSSYNANAANAASKFGRDGVTLRSINAGGTVNASGADYAEYMVKCSDFVLAKGDVAGIDANGKLTNVFADAISFVVKSTDPSYVGNDKWGVGLEGADLESARQLVDRIAFAGQVPVNVTGAKAGDYIVPVANGTGIKGQAVSNPTFEQYQLAVGKVIGIDADGRARIIVKVA
jgi:hypothetical protein